MDCNVVKKNLGLSRCNSLPAMPRGMITTANDFKLTPVQMASASAIQQALQDAIVAGLASRIYFWPLFKGFENVSEEPVYEDTPLSLLRVRDGQYRFRFQISENMCIHKNMYTHRANNGRVFILDSENQLLGTEDESGNMLGFSIALLNTEKLIISDGSVSTKSPVYLVLADNKELDQTGVLLSVPFINTLERLTDVTATIVGTPTASEIVVDIAAECDGTPISGLVQADFIVKDAAGDAVVLSGVTEVDGRYTLTSAAAFVTGGTVELALPADLSIQAYELVEAADVTFP